jgi:periplasmic divalent cation tolerance protein
VSDAGEVAAGDLRLVLSTAPDASTASRLARALVEERLAACVTVLPGARSTFRWELAIEEAVEVVLLIKTTAAATPALAARLTELHPYAVPEILAFEPVAGASSYLGWIASSVGTGGL